MAPGQRRRQIRSQQKRKRERKIVLHGIKTLHEDSFNVLSRTLNDGFVGKVSPNSVLFRSARSIFLALTWGTKSQLKQTRGDTYILEMSANVGTKKKTTLMLHSTKKGKFSPEHEVFIQSASSNQIMGVYIVPERHLSEADLKSKQDFYQKLFSSVKFTVTNHEDLRKSALAD